MKYLELYYQWMETGELPNRNGLCNEFGQCYGWDDTNDELFQLFIPQDESEMINKFQWIGYRAAGYWASDIRGTRHYSFNEIRQNIVLLMAAMNGEL